MDLSIKKSYKFVFNSRGCIDRTLAECIQDTQMAICLNLQILPQEEEQTSEQEIDAVVFDCDGVLLETIPAKLQAYMDWLPEQYEALREVYAAHNRKSFGQSRSLQIQYFYEKLVGMNPVTKEFIEEEVERFAAICEPLCEAAPWAEGAKEFIQACRDAGSSTYVLSGTPQLELEVMLKQRMAMGLFDDVMGYPITKEQGLEKVRDNLGIDPCRILFVGDAQRDAEAALAVGTHFVYRPSEANRPTVDIVNEEVNLLDLLPLKS